MKSTIFCLPFEVDESGLPVLKSLECSNFFFQGVIAEFDNNLYLGLGRALGIRGFLRWHLYDAGLGSILRFRAPPASLAYHCEPDRWYSSLNAVAQHEDTHNAVFLNADKTRSIFIGTGDFVKKCLALFPSNPENQMQKFCEDYMCDQEQQADALKFVRTYSRR